MVFDYGLFAVTVGHLDKQLLDAHAFQHKVITVTSIRVLALVTAA
jgi:hypothetical protein